MGGVAEPQQHGQSLKTGLAKEPHVLPFDFTVLGLAEVDRLSPDAVTHACSILDPGESVPFGLRHLGVNCRLDLRLHDVVDDPPDLQAAQYHHALDILNFGRFLSARVGSRPRLLVHCQLGLSRSTAAAVLLVAQALPDLPASDIIETVLGVRADAWPNLRLVALGDVALGRAGTLALATRLLLDHQARKNPILARYMEFDGLGCDTSPDGTLPARRLPKP